MSESCLSIPVRVVDRFTIQAMFALERSFVEKWLDSGCAPIPQMPHIPGKPVKFHVPTVEAWLLKYFQRGGDAAAKASDSRTCPRCGHSFTDTAAAR